MLCHRLRNYRKKISIVMFVLMFITILNRTQDSASRDILISPGNDEIWDEKEWFEIKNEFNKILSSQRGLLVVDNSSNSSLNVCDLIPKKLKTRIKIFKYPSNFNATTDQINSYNINNYNQTSTGRWKPNTCKSRHRVAIIIPYKNRLDNLNYFLTHMHPFLQRQELEYQIFVVEQSNDQLFNKGVLMNAGFLEVMNITSYDLSLNNLTFQFDCVIFHDVDLLPEDDRIMYSCPFYKPRHLSVAIDKYKYKMAYYRLIGGVLNFRPSHFIRVNGYSNQYWGWGAEDDDMEVRLSKIKLGFERPNINIAHYRMLKHSARFKNPKRKKLLKEAQGRYTNDGINSVSYRVTDILNYKLFTHILIDVGEPPKYIQDLMNPEKRISTLRHRLESMNRTEVISTARLLVERMKSEIATTNNG